MKNADKVGESAEDMPPPNVGALLKAHMKRNRYFQSGLARAMGVDGDAVGRYLKRASLGTDTLWAVSIALKHNFFADLAAGLPVEFTTEVAADTSKEKEIVRLEEELRVVRAERDLLRGILGGAGRG